MNYILNTRHMELRLAAMLAAHLVFLPHTHAQIIIDDFGDVPSPPGYQRIVVNLPNTTAESTYSDFDSSILGHTRTIALLDATGPVLQRVSALVDPLSTMGFNGSHDLNVQSLCLLQYDGGTDRVLDPEGLGGINLGLVSSGRFCFEFSKDNPSVSLTLRVYTDAERASAATVSWGAGAVVEPVEVELAFAAFTPIGSAGGVDFGRVGAIELLITGDAGLDFGLDNLVAVPEPSWSMGLAGFGVLAWAGGRRARREGIG